MQPELDNKQTISTPQRVLPDPLHPLLFDQLANTFNWRAPTFTNGWVNYSVTFNDCGYVKDAMGFVHLRGLVKNGTDGTSIFTLPVGYRPEKAELLVCASEDHYGRLDIAPAGTVTPSAASTAPGWVSLDGIIFKASK